MRDGSIYHDHGGTFEEGDHRSEIRASLSGSVGFANSRTTEAAPASDDERDFAYGSELFNETKKFDDQRSTLNLNYPAATTSRLQSRVDFPEQTPCGDYLLIRELGRGGMGVVYEAWQLSLNRRVALKRLRCASFATEKDLLRFKAEAEVIAALNHPNIVPIYEIGEYQGESYFSMKLFEGQDLRSRLADFTGKPRDGSRLVATIARAVQYAHQRGILHRDLKPSNILLDSDDQPQLIDFGLARWIDQEGEGYKDGVVGTPNFMAPEQATGRNGSTTSLSDVYGLGGILYALLTGRPPFRGDTTRDLLRQVVEEEPTPPSQLNLRIDRDLERICMKCLSKVPQARYATAQEVAEDLEHWLAREPIRARDYTQFERILLWSLRKPMVAALWAALLLAVVLGVIGTVAAMLNARYYARQAIARGEENRKEAYLAKINLGAREYRDANISHLLELLKETEPAPDREDLRGFEWYYLRSLCNQDRLTLNADTRPLREFDFSPDGSRLVTVGDLGVIQVWETTGGRKILSLPQDGVPIRSVGFAPNGREFVTGSVLGELKLWDVATGQVLREYKGLTERARQVMISPDGKQVAAGGEENKLLVWDLDTARLIHTLDARRLRQIAYSRDGKRLASASPEKTLKIWDSATGQLIKSFDNLEDKAHCLDFSDDGTKLAVGLASKVVVFSTTDWTRLLDFPAELSNQLVIGVDFSPDGTKLVTGGFDQVVRVWDSASGKPLRSFKGHAGTVYDVKFHPTQPLLAAADSNGSVKIWGIDDEQDLEKLVGHAGRIKDLKFARSGAWFASAGEDGKVLMWEASTRKVFLTLAGHQGAITQISVSPDGAILASVGLDRTMQLWETATGKLLHKVTDDNNLFCVAFGPDSRLLAYSGKSRDITVYDAVRHRAVWTLRGHLGTTRDLSFSPDGARLASCGEDGQVRIWDLASGRPIGPSIARVQDGSTITCVAFSPDGRQLATAGRDALVRLWDARSGVLIRTLRGHMKAVYDVAFSPDGRRLVSGGSDCLRLWNLELGRELIAFEPYDPSGSAVEFSPDGKSLVSVGDNATIRVRGYKNLP